MEKELTTKIIKTTGYTNAGTKGLGQSRKQFSVELLSNDPRGNYKRGPSGVYSWRLKISMSQHYWENTYSLARFEWSLRDVGLGVEFEQEIPSQNDVKELYFIIKQFYGLNCNRR